MKAQLFLNEPPSMNERTLILLLLRRHHSNGLEVWEKRGVEEELHWFYADAASGMHDKRMRGMNRWRKRETERVRGWIIAGESAPSNSIPVCFEWGRNACSRIVYLLWDIRCRESVSFNWMPIFRIHRGANGRCIGLSPPSYPGILEGKFHWKKKGWCPAMTVV